MLFVEASAPAPALADSGVYWFLARAAERPSVTRAWALAVRPTFCSVSAKTSENERCRGGRASDTSSMVWSRPPARAGPDKAVPLRALMMALARVAAESVLGFVEVALEWMASLE